MVDEYCKGCKYLGVLSRCPYCSYSDVTGHSRGCSSGTGCTVREAGKKANAPSYFAFHHEPTKTKNSTQKRTKREYTDEEFAERESKRKKASAARNRELLQGRQRQAILDYKVAHDLTAKQMATLVGVSATTLNKWLTEYSKANWELLAKFGINKPEC